MSVSAFNRRWAAVILEDVYKRQERAGEVLSNRQGDSDKRKTEEHA